MARNAVRFKDEGISLEKIINSIQYRFARCKELLDIVFIANRKEDMSARKIVSWVIPSSYSSYLGMFCCPDGSFRKEDNTSAWTYTL